MVVWYVNYLYGTPFDNNNMDEFIFNDPSWGAKARVLVADVRQASASSGKNESAGAEAA